MGCEYTKRSLKDIGLILIGFLEYLVPARKLYKIIIDPEIVAILVELDLVVQDQVEMTEEDKFYYSTNSKSFNCQVLSNQVSSGP